MRSPRPLTTSRPRSVSSPSTPMLLQDVRMLQALIQHPRERGPLVAVLDELAGDELVFEQQLSCASS